MNDPRAFIDHVGQVLEQCDASTLPALPADPDDERQALVEASPATRSHLVRATDTSPEPVIQIAQPKPPSWWRRILRRQR